MRRMRLAVNNPLRRVAHFVRQRRTEPHIGVEHTRRELNLCPLLLAFCEEAAASGGAP